MYGEPRCIRGTYQLCCTDKLQSFHSVCALDSEGLCIFVQGANLRSNEWLLSTRSSSVPRLTNAGVPEVEFDSAHVSVPATGSNDVTLEVRLSVVHTPAAHPTALARVHPCEPACGSPHGRLLVVFVPPGLSSRWNQDCL